MQHPIATLDFLPVVDLLGIIGILVVLATARRRASDSRSDRLVDQVTAQLGESELRMAQRLGEFRAELLGAFDGLREDMNNLHKRVEYLEQRDRDRPS